MIVAGMTGVRAKKKPRLVGELRERAPRLVAFIDEEGETLKEYISTRARAYAPPRYAKKTKMPRYAILPQFEPGNLDVILINLKNMEVTAEPAFPYHHLLQHPHVTQPLFIPEAEPLRRWSGIYGMSPRQAQKLYVMAREKGGLGMSLNASITNDERYISISCPQETRIYDLKTGELIGIITGEHVIGLLLKGGRKDMLNLMDRNIVFTMSLDPEKPSEAWIFLSQWAKNWSYCVFKVDLESWEVVSPIKHVMEIIFDSGLDEVFKPAKIVRKEDLYRLIRDDWGRTLNPFAIPHISPEGNLVLNYVLEYRYIYGRASFNYSDPTACEKHGFSTHPPTHEYFFVEVDAQLEPKHHVRDFYVKETGGYYYVSILWEIRPWDVYTKNEVFDSVTANMDRIDGIARFDRGLKFSDFLFNDRVEGSFKEVFSFDGERFDCSVDLNVGTGLVRDELVLFVEVRPWTDWWEREGLVGSFHIVRSDWGGRVRLVAEYEPDVSYDVSYPHVIGYWALWVP